MKRFSIILLVVSIMAAGAMALLALGCGGGGKGDPAEVIDRAYAKSFDYDTLHSEYDVQLKISGDASTLSPELQGILPLELGISGSADIDNSDTENPKMQATVSLDGLNEIIQGLVGGTSANETEAAATANMIGSLFSNLEFKMIDKVFYVNMMGSWYQVDTNEVASQVGGGTDEVDSKCIQDAVKEKVVPSAVLTGIEEIGSEEIDGKQTTHYKASIDMAKLVDAAAEASRQCDQAETAGGLEGAKSQLNEMFKKTDVELWVDGDDNVRRFKIDVEIDTAALSNMGDTPLGSDQEKALESMSIAITATVNQSGFNEDVDITAPEGALPLEDLLGGLGVGGNGLGGGFGGMGGAGATSSTTTNPFNT